VKGFNTRSWGFPKGKINKDEPEIDCAAREVYEETGFDIRSVDLSLDDYIVVIVREQQIKLYIVPFVGEDTYFEPKTRKEIEVIINRGNRFSEIQLSLYRQNCLLIFCEENRF